MAVKILINYRLLIALLPNFIAYILINNKTFSKNPYSSSRVGAFLRKTFMNSSPIRIVVGMSGGVDSSVAALLLKEQGYHVEGAFMKNWEEDDKNGFCQASVDFTDAQVVCDKLNIPLHSINFSKEYWEHVFSYFLEEYRAGRTPNPDILCNKEIKFKVFLQYAKQLNAQFLATGHYAQVQEVNGQFQLVKGLDPQKDQSYFLHALNQEQLSQSLFPVGQLEKPIVREIAKKAGLPTHAKKDSVGICFIGERKFKAFLNEYLPAQPGNMETPEGRIIGQHDGLMFYTLGQRQGLRIGGMKNQGEAPWYVVRKDIDRNVLVVAQGNHPELYKESLVTERVNWINTPPQDYPLRISAKTRYRQADQICVIEPLENRRYKVTFDELQRAITPGQSIVFYDKEVCLGGGVILS